MGCAQATTSLGAMTLPSFRVDIQISAHNEGQEQYIVLNDPFGVAEGPIMLHADMIDIVSLCDGETTLDDVAASAGVDIDGPEMMQVRLFIAQLERMGYFDGETANERFKQVAEEWSALAVRPPVCAGNTYPADAHELARFLDAMAESDAASDEEVHSDQQSPSMVLLPHIDFRVAPHVYGRAFRHLRSIEADVAVIIGTSHYWDGDPIVVTNKPFETPLGVVPVMGHPFYRPRADLAHKPEHSIELHVVLLQHLWQGRTFEILPILVTQSIFEQNALEQVAEQIRNVVEASGRKACWLISGDLAHIGRKFGDDAPAFVIANEVKAADLQLVNALEENDLARYRTSIETHRNRFRVCGFAPTVLAHTAYKAGKGRSIAYDMWNEEETQSAVSFATIIWD